MRRLFATILASMGFGARATERVIQLQQQFGPNRAFSVTIPTDWGMDAGENFRANGPNDSPSLSVSAYRIDQQLSLTEFASARYQGVLAMGFYHQVGGERALSASGGVVREYEGVWPGENFNTYYVVACKCAGSVYACLSITTAKTNYTANRVLYEKIISTFEVYPQ
jgi:hypothetical protein